MSTKGPVFPVAYDELAMAEALGNLVAAAGVARA
jgi:hypothetical protein